MEYAKLHKPSNIIKLYSLLGIDCHANQRPITTTRSVCFRYHTAFML
jgi:hypothetical protein